MLPGSSLAHMRDVAASSRAKAETIAERFRLAFLVYKATA